MNKKYNLFRLTPNLNPEIVKQIAEGLALKFVPEKNSPLTEGCPQGGVVISLHRLREIEHKFKRDEFKPL